MILDFYKTKNNIQKAKACESKYTVGIIKFIL